jgi:hypothetical protein
MNNLLHYGVLLAQESRLESMGRVLNRKRSNFDTQALVVGLMVVGCMALAIWALSYISTIRERRWARTSPALLFLTLCKAHGLCWSDTWLLWRVARSQRLRDAGRLFLEPERLEVANLRPSLRSQASRLEDIQRRLFEDPLANLGDEEESGEFWSIAIGE